MNDMIFFYPIAILAILIVGISKSGFGDGLGILGVPLLSLVIPVPQAAAILLPLLIVIDWLTVWHYYHRKYWDQRSLLILLPASMFGILVGSLFFRYLSENDIKILTGVMAVLFVAHGFLKPHTLKPHPAKITSGMFWGAVAGFTSFGVHAGGPPLSIYLLPQQLPKSVFVGTTVLFFTIVNLIKVIPYILLGQFNRENLLTSLFLAPVVPLGVWLGLKFHHRVNEQLFYKLSYVFLLVTGIKLLIDGFQGLFR
jgi:hypothetical protein